VSKSSSLWSAWSWRSRWHASLGVALACGLFAVAAIVWWVAHVPSTDLNGGQPPAPVASATVNDSEVHLSSEKLAAAQLHVAPVGRRMLQESRRVPGTITYNSARRLEVKLPVGGVVKQALAQPGQRVQVGDKLALLNSVEVGMARDEVANAETDADLAHKENEWAAEIADHLNELLRALHERPPVAEVEEKFDSKVLGTHRDRIVSAYSKLLLAEKSAATTTAAAGDGAIAGIVVRERSSAREVAAANFQSACEESTFQAMQEKRRKQAAVDHADRLVSVKKQQLATLLGPFSEITSAADEEGLCELVLRAPIAGMVEERLVTTGTHFVAAQRLYVIANTDTLNVSAQIFEREWGLLNAKNITELIVESPAVPDRKVRAKLLFVSVSVAPDSRAVPLVAEISNADGRFKPGMFAWVMVPMGEPFEALAVPSSAVSHHEQQAIVFVEERPGDYRKVDVETGLETPEWIEIKHGLEAGQRVVDQGVFLLKSELLLVGEES